MSQIISSESNSKFKMWKSLTTAKGIKQELAFILSGEKIIREYLQSQELQIQFPLWSILVPCENSAIESIETKKIESNFAQSKFGADILQALKSKTTFVANKDLFYLPKNLFDSIDVVGTHQPLLILKFTEFATWSPEAIDNHSVAPTTAPKSLIKNSIYDSKGDVELISPVGDPKNLGAILRSCDAFGVSKIILTAESCHPFLPQALKASSLSALRMTFFKGPSLKEIFLSKENPSQKINSSASIKNKNDDSSMVPPNATAPLITAVPFLALD
jgi:TrmH family RNA methyltransferase